MGQSSLGPGEPELWRIGHNQIRAGAQGPKALNVWDLRPFASPSAKII